MFKEIFRYLVNRSGYEIMTVGRAHGYPNRVASILGEQQINMILDVGANMGQFAEWIRKVGYAGAIVSFEPLANAHRELCRAAQLDKNWNVAPVMALGCERGEATIHVSRNGVSSSLLAMDTAHKQAAPDSNYIRTERVALNRLDDVCSPSPADRLLLKIDVQGNEKSVLEGAASVLSFCRAIIIEMSLVSLYEGQPLALELWEYLAALGFQAHYFNPGFRDPKSGRLLQMDGLFARD
jgi:FkbM family methyltransferase